MDTKDKEYLDNYEISLYRTLRDFLLGKQLMDERKVDAPDLDDMWERICQSYLTDGIREFNAYPTVSLGWMMFIGMALAKMWDDDWEKYSKEKDLYFALREVRGYDYMDEYICEDVLHLDSEAAKELTKLVGDVALMVHNALQKEGFEPATPMAFHAYVRTLRQLYNAGVGVQLKKLGYHMVRMGQ